jgi:hypothetical protein
MRTLLGRRVTPVALDEIACWIIGALLLLACTVLTMKIAPDLSQAPVDVLWTFVAMGWGVLAWQACMIGRRRMTLTLR